MDAVSYSLASKQAQRIEKFIENPDSDSGVVTTPKVIQSGETITIPDGRMAVLPDLVIEGDLVLEGTGDVFIPSGSTLTGTVTLDTAQTITGPKEFTQSPKVPDGVNQTDAVNKGQLDNSSISKVASSVLLSGSLAVDTGNLSIINGKLAFTNGRNSNGGYKVETQDFTGSVDFSGISDGIKYIARDKLGNVFGYDGVSIGLYEKTSADDNRLVFDTESGKWFTTTGGELVTNGSGNTTTGWNVTAPSTLTADGNLIFTRVSGGSSWTYTTITTEVGIETTIELNLNGIGSSNIVVYIGETEGSEEYLRKITTSTGKVSVTFIPNTTTTYIAVGGSDYATYKFNNVTAYKKEATLGTELPNPICFIDDKPYQVTSGTPMDRLVDYPSIPKNVMESTYVDGMFISNGNRKIIELGTIFNNNRYVIDNPFGNENYEDCDVRVELYYMNKWFGAGDVSLVNSDYCGVKAHSQLEGVVIQTARNSMNAYPYSDGNGSGNNFTLTSALARVIVTYVGEAK